jgi:hypothetical protein
MPTTASGEGRATAALAFLNTGNNLNEAIAPLTEKRWTSLDSNLDTLSSPLRKESANDFMSSQFNSSMNSEMRKASVNDFMSSQFNSSMDSSMNSDMSSNGCPLHTLIAPLRKASANDFMSSQFNSSMDSSLNTDMSSITCNSFGIVQQYPTPSKSKNNLLRYTNMGESFGNPVNQNNFMWISSPASSSLNSNSNSNTIKKKMKSASSSSHFLDNQRRWLATAASEKARDQPISMIRRNSSTYLFPLSA